MDSGFFAVTPRNRHSKQEPMPVYQKPKVKKSEFRSSSPPSQRSPTLGDLNRQSKRIESYMLQVLENETEWKPPVEKTPQRVVRSKLELDNSPPATKLKKGSRYFSGFHFESKHSLSFQTPLHSSKQTQTRKNFTLLSSNSKLKNVTPNVSPRILHTSKQKQMDSQDEEKEVEQIREVIDDGYDFGL